MFVKLNPASLQSRHPIPAPNPMACELPLLNA
jgi:hypothetical protein